LNFGERMRRLQKGRFFGRLAAAAGAGVPVKRRVCSWAHASATAKIANTATAATSITIVETGIGYLLSKTR
jgi:hypothetical protein